MTGTNNVHFFVFPELFTNPNILFNTHIIKAELQELIIAY